MSATMGTEWRIAGESLVTCNCDWGCPCQFNALPTNDNCEALLGWEIREGYFGSRRLDGVRFARIYWWPGPIHEGNGIRQMIVDEGATDEQRDALLALDTGAHGYPYFEIFAAVCPNVLESVTAPIGFEIDRERRTGRLSVPGIGETVAEPIRNPVTGEEHRARIVLPNGFEYKEAEIGNAVRLSVRTGDLAFEHENVYAQLTEFDWSNV